MTWRYLLVASVFTTPLTSLGGEDQPNVRVGYHDGFYAATSDDNYRIKIGSRLDFGYTYGFTSPDDFSSFDLYHAKIYAGGNVFQQWLQFYFQAAFENKRHPSFAPSLTPTESQFVLEDYFARFAKGEWQLKLGQFKTPFGRQWMTYSGNLQFVDRSIATRIYTLGRDLGTALTIDRPTFSTTLSIVNGGGSPLVGSGYLPADLSTTGQNVSNDTAGGGTDMLYIARISMMPWGSAGFSEGDIEHGDVQRFELGGGYAFDQGRDVDLNGDGAVDDIAADIQNASGELVWKSKGYAFQGECFFRHIDPSAGAASSGIGFYVQPSTFVGNDKFEIAGRVSWVDPNLDVPHDQLWEAAGVANLYFRPDHRYKTQLQYTWRSRDLPLGGSDQQNFIDLLLQVTI